MSYPLDRFGPSGPPDNFFKTKDAEVLASVQTSASDFRHWELSTGRQVIRGGYDATHFRQVHNYLMQDVYPWAGETRQDQPAPTLRDRSSEATGALLTFEKPHNVNDRLDELGAQLKRENYLRGHGLAAFVDRLTHYYDQYNQVAPFRGGNAATLNAMTEMLAKGAGYTVRLEQAPTLSIEADRALEAGPKGSRQSLTTVLAGVTTPSPGVEAELLRRPSLREMAPVPTRRMHEAENQREMQQAGALMADQLGGRVGGKPQYLLFKQSVDEITSGDVSPQNLQVVRQIGELIRSAGYKPDVVNRFDHATSNLAELKGYYQAPAAELMPSRQLDYGRAVTSQQER